MSIIKKLLFIIWQIPQQCVGCFLYLKNKKKIKEKFVYKDCTIYIWNKKYSASYGNFIFLKDAYDFKVLSHEYGHHMISIFFGPISIIADIISLLWYILYNKLNLKNKNIKYTSFFIEKFANYLGYKYTKILPIND